MRTAVTITVRMKSVRLPKKVTKMLVGKTIIGHLIERVKRAEFPNEIILCTSTNPQDDILVKIAKKNNIRCFRGDEIDVFKRLYEAAKKHKLDFIVSTTGDNPLTDPYYIDKIIEKFKKTNADYITCLDLPWGTFSYGVKVKAMEKVLKLKKEEDTEVWGQYFTKSNLFKIEKVDIDEALKNSNLRLTVDTPEDFEFMEKIYSELYPRNNAFTLLDVIELVEEKPELKKLMRKFSKKLPTQLTPNH